MKEKILKRKLKQEVSRLLKEQETNSFKASQNDPSTSCSGRGICCINPTTNEQIKAKFSLKRNKRVVCKCPEGFRKIICEQ